MHATTSCLRLSFTKCLGFETKESGNENVYRRVSEGKAETDKHCLECNRPTVNLGNRYVANKCIF